MDNAREGLSHRSRHNWSQPIFKCLKGYFSQQYFPDKIPLLVFDIRVSPLKRGIQLPEFHIVCNHHINTLVKSFRYNKGLHIVMFETPYVYKKGLFW